MLTSTIATSGLSLFTFSTASLPFAASPITRQPLRERRSPRMPRRTSSWSSASNMRTVLVRPLIYSYRHAHDCAAATGIDCNLSPDDLNAFAHTGDANAKPKWNFPVLHQLL